MVAVDEGGESAGPYARGFVRDVVDNCHDTLLERLYRAPRTLGTIAAMQAVGMDFTSSPDGNVH